MSATKEVKVLLDELRSQLDPELVVHVEPILRRILDAAKPKTVTEVEYRSDPKDKSEIDSLRATIHAKEDAIRKLENKLADRPPAPKVVHLPHSPEHLSRKQRLDELDARARAWATWAQQCMVLMSKNEDDLRRRKQVLTKLVGPMTILLSNYISLLEGLHKRVSRADMLELPAVVDHTLVEWLSMLEEDVYEHTGAKVDRELLVKAEMSDFDDPEIVALARSAPTMQQPKP